MPIAVLAEALSEAREAVDSLEAARPGLGSAFTTALAQAFLRLEAHPEIGASAEFANATRRWKLARFPYSIIYILSAERIVVVAIAHEHRRPGYWQGRTH